MRAAFQLFNTTHAHAWRTLLRLIASHLRNCIVFAPAAFRRNGFIRGSSETNFQRSEMFETLTLPCNFQLLEIESKLDALSQIPLLLGFINRADRQLKNRNETRTKQRNQSLSSALWNASLRFTNQLINRHDRKRGLFSSFLFAFFSSFFFCHIKQTWTSFHGTWIADIFDDVHSMTIHACHRYTRTWAADHGRTGSPKCRTGLPTINPIFQILSACIYAPFDVIRHPQAERAKLCAHRHADEFALLSNGFAD